jgi:hypothetical protein
MKHNNNTIYPDLYAYYVLNEFEDPNNDPDHYLESLRNDTRNDELIGEIWNLFNIAEDIEYMSTLPTGVIKDMFAYYIKHK